jgi:hypothetical protein
MLNTVKTGEVEAAGKRIAPNNRHGKGGELLKLTRGDSSVFRG